ncbi:MAG: MCP four helix bundle domain-containing protein, partial [Deltaproteobacteria bacterium]|nr:MCP four helix bundle domain-containing protein [Deltaproteobacteria bacterium]
MDFKNMKLSTKLVAAFVAVAVILLIVGLVGMKNINSLTGNTEKIVTNSPLIEAAMEMKLAVTLDRVLIMELLEAGDKAGADEVWREHEEAVESFDTYADAIISGAKTDKGIFYATNDDALKAIVEESEEFHEGEFEARIDQIYENKLQH